MGRAALPQHFYRYDSQLKSHRMRGHPFGILKLMRDTPSAKLAARLGVAHLLLDARFLLDVAEARHASSLLLSSAWRQDSSAGSDLLRHDPRHHACAASMGGGPHVPCCSSAERIGHDHLLLLLALSCRASGSVLSSISTMGFRAQQGVAAGLLQGQSCRLQREWRGQGAVRKLLMAPWDWAPCTNVPRTWLLTNDEALCEDGIK